ncbi:Apple-like [Penicillium camemberti]|uniref:Apple-like n=1 Tax=Penicillium camemberti (strain FM 013) TaxID=1429867 RepID=A0A0G4PQR1_PENC3|nr:Apple-like [Penicillium camemberti]
MIVKCSLLLLSAAFAFATDQIPIGESSICLASSDPNACCTGGATTGKVVIADRTFEFTCGSKLISLDSNKAQTFNNAHECASECAADPSCEASAFKAKGPPARGGKNCFFVMGDNMRQKSDEAWIGFTEVIPTCLGSDDPNSCCSDLRIKEGEVFIDDVRWKWTCDSILASANTTPRQALNVQDCASQCAAEGCDAISYRKDGKRADKCYFVRGDNKDQKQANAFITVAKVVDDVVEPPAPEPGCAEDLAATEQKLQTCLSNQQDPAKLNQCEADKLALENAGKDCRREAEQFEQKKEEWRFKHQQCETEKGNISLDKQKLENDKSALKLQLDHKDDEIAALNSQIATLKGKLSGLRQAYEALDIECNGEGPDGKCRTNIYDAEPGDDLCIIDAGNEKFKIYYGKLDDEGFSDLGSGRANSFKDCAERCANYKGAKKCVRFLWSTDGKDRSCYMRSQGKERIPTQSSKWSSGQLL